MSGPAANARECINPGGTHQKPLLFVGGGKVVGEHKIKSIGGNLGEEGSDCRRGPSQGHRFKYMPIDDAFRPGEKHPNHLFPNGVVSVTFQGAHGYASAPTIGMKVTSNMAGLEKVIESKTGAEHVFYDRFNKSVSLQGTSTPPRYVVAMPRGALSGGMMSATAAEDTSLDPQVSNARTSWSVTFHACTHARRAASFVFEPSHATSHFRFCTGGNNSRH